MAKQTIGVLLLNLGGPDSMQAVRPFLFNLFSDRQIIKLGPGFLQKPLARLISSIRSKKTEKLYQLIGGRSPLLDITKLQAAALEETLNKKSAIFKVFVGMRYWRPLIEDTIKEIHNAGINKLVVLSLYPQYSIATTGSAYSKAREVLQSYPTISPLCIHPWFKHSGYIDALVDVIKKGMESFSDKNVHVLFSAHSLPQKLIDEGDPYVHQLMESIEEVSEKIRINWHLSYQSKTGPVKWLSPTTGEKLSELADKGVRQVLVVPISFVSDHIETLYEIDILYKQMADRLGITLKRTESLNTHPLFINALKNIVMDKVKESDWEE
ncbi:MAG: ferrochelatase [Nitrospiraceae bacterium]|nr:ferrochelatase [Nitrospiraceae bacterium]